MGPFILAGTFNGWSARVTRLADPDGDGIWTMTMNLAGRALGIQVHHV